MLRLSFPLVTFILGLGVSWSVFEFPDIVSSRAIPGAELANRRYVARMKEMFGQETAEFVEQFEEMSIRINEYPVNACASPDGRFVIRLFGAEEAIASDLCYPDTEGNMNELVRHYSFSCNGMTYSCDLGRSAEDGKMTSVLFSVADAQGHYLSYLDSDADGRWDGFSDHTRKPPRVYPREGLTWKRHGEGATAE